MTFIDFCRERGVLIDKLPPEGVWLRYRTEDKPQHRNGAVKFMGDHGMVQNHATMTQVAVWHTDAATAPAVDDPVADERRRHRAAVDRQREHAAVARARAFFWQAAQPVRQLHPYLARKGLAAFGTMGLRTHGGSLVVPVMRDDQLISVQTIDAEGTKKFFSGAPVKGGGHVIGRRRPAVTCFVEGLATGLAVFQSVRHSRVVVAFNTSNLLSVAERIKPSGSVVVCADNDRATLARRGVNPGLDAARNLADYLGCGVAWPQGIEGSDWCDYLAEVGEGAAGRLEREVMAQARYVLPVRAAP